MLAVVFGTSAIACVAGPFAVVAQRHAPKPVAPPAVTHTVVAAEAVTVVRTETPEAPVAPVPHTFRVADLASDSRVSVHEGTVGKHGFLGAIAAAGLSPKEAHRVLVGFSGVRNLDRESAATTFTFAKAKSDAHVVAFELLPANAAEGDSLEFFQEHEKTDGDRLVASHVSLPIDKKRVKVGIVVGGDAAQNLGGGEALKSSLTSAGLHEEAASALDDALEGHAELSDLRAGTHLRIVATELRIEGVFTGYGPIDALEYTAPSKPAVRIYWYGAHHHGGFYDATGRQSYRGGWRSPVPMARISSRFNPNRMHPVLHVIMPHNGVDFAAAPGTPVYAAAAGTIRSVGDSGPCGNMVQIDHGVPAGGGTNLISAYCHLSRFANISAGEHVEARQLIGYVGQTGRATGPHLHFAVKRLNPTTGMEQFIDPLSMRLDGVRIIPPRFRGDFDELKKTLDAEIDSITLPESKDVPKDTTTTTNNGNDEPAETE
ncbi:MAG TPA: peptidoglycan DD-metalloendopeptidase family protein [Polyangiaceae bacterium]